jgi:hypothetical protein
MLLRNGKRKSDYNFTPNPKRAKKSTKTVTTDLSKLPLELQIHLVKNYLPTKDKLRLRLVNKRFKQIVDNLHGFMENLKLKLLIYNSNKNDLVNSINFIQKSNKLNEIELECPNELRTKGIQIRNRKDTNLNVNITSINLKSLHIINTYSDLCDKLDIKQIIRNLGTANLDTILDKLSINKNLCLKLDKIKDLRINFDFENKADDKDYEELILDCLQYDIFNASRDYFDSSTDSISIIGSQEEEENSHHSKKLIYKRLFLDNNLINDEKVCGDLIDAFEINKTTLKKLHLTCYTGPLKSLLELVNDTRLDEFILYDCFPSATIWNYSFSNNKQEIYAKQIDLCCPLFSMHRLLKYHINFDVLESINLDAFLTDEYSDEFDSSNEEANVYLDMLIDMLKILDDRLKNLRKFQISLDYFVALQRSNLTLPSSIEELLFTREIHIDRAFELINSALRFKDGLGENLNLFEIYMFIDCNDMKNLNKLRVMLKTLANQFKSLKTIVLGINCDHRIFEEDESNFKLKNDCQLYTQFRIGEKHEFILKDFIQFDGKFNKNLKILIK